MKIVILQIRPLLFNLQFNFPSWGLGKRKVLRHSRARGGMGNAIKLRKETSEVSIQILNI